MAVRGLPVFVINLDSATARLEKITRELHARGIGFERIAAVDGRRLADPGQFVSPFSRLISPAGLLPQEIGCWLSHRKVWERIAADRIPLALVLEDDASPRVDHDELRSIELSGTPLDLLRVHVRKQEKVLSSERSVRTGTFLAAREVILPYEETFSATAYFVTLGGAQRLLARQRMLAPVDWFTLWGALDGLRHGVLLPKMFEAEDDGRSTIGFRKPAGLARLHFKFLKRHFIPRAQHRNTVRLAHELESLVATRLPSYGALHEAQ